MNTKFKAYTRAAKKFYSFLPVMKQQLYYQINIFQSSSSFINLLIILKNDLENIFEQ